MRRLPAAALVVAVAGLVVGFQAHPGLAASLSLTSQPLTPYRTCTLTATPTTTVAVADATVRQGSAGTNYGTATTANVASSNGANRRLYVRFDLTACSPTIPATAIVRLATLRLFATSPLPAVCRTVDVFDSTSSWTETGLTWSNQPMGTTPNTPASSGATGTLVLGSPSTCANHTAGAYVSVAVTADVAAFIAGTGTNYGWMLRDDAENSGTAYTVTFNTKELGTVAAEPQLVVTWVAVP